MRTLTTIVLVLAGLVGMPACAGEPGAASNTGREEAGGLCCGGACETPEGYCCTGVCCPDLPVYEP